MGSTLVDLVVHMMVSHICHGTIMPFERTVRLVCVYICVYCVLSVQYGLLFIMTEYIEKTVIVAFWKKILLGLFCL